jgi:hypothetical protein
MAPLYILLLLLLSLPQPTTTSTTPLVRILPRRPRTASPPDDHEYLDDDDDPLLPPFPPTNCPPTPPTLRSLSPPGLDLLAALLSSPSSPTPTQYTAAVASLVLLASTPCPPLHDLLPLARALRSLCASRPPPDVATTLALLEHMQTLASLAHATGVDFSRCGLQAGAPTSLPFCLPHNARPCDVRAAVWGAPSSSASPPPRELLVAYVSAVGALSTLSFLAHPRAVAFTRDLLAEGLGVGGPAPPSAALGAGPPLPDDELVPAATGVNGTGAGAALVWGRWHPTGIPPPPRSDPPPPLLLVRPADVLPQYAFYFSASYHFVDLERPFKAALHARMAGFLPAVPAVAEAASALVAGTDAMGGSSRGPLVHPPPRFVLSRSPACAAHVLVVDTFYYRGFASHRVTTPLVHAMQRARWGREGETTATTRGSSVEAPRRRLCLYLLYGYGSSSSSKGGGGGGGGQNSPPPQDDADDDVDGFEQAIGAPAWDEGRTGAAWRVAAAHTIRETGFDLVWFASVGMAPFDISLASFRLGAVQAMSVGHPASTGSADSMDAFVSGALPEVLGPVSAPLDDVWADDGSSGGGGCTHVVDAAAELLERMCVDGLGAGPAPSAALPPLPTARFPLLVMSDGRLCGAFSAAINHHNTTAPPASRRVNPRCRGVDGSGDGGALDSTTLLRRLVDAQARYSERLVLVPGIGMGLTDLVTRVALPLRRRPTPHPSRTILLDGAAALSAFLSEAAPRHALARRLARVPFVDGGAGLAFAGASPSHPLTLALSWSNPKHNARHFGRVLDCIAAAHLLYRRMWTRCVDDHVLRGSFVCASLLRRADEGESGGWKGEPAGLHVRLLLFTPMDALRSVGLQAILQRQIRAHPVLADAPPVIIEHVSRTNGMADYLGRLADADLALDAQPFAGGNTMQDLLALAVPVLSLAHDGDFGDAGRNSSSSSTSGNGAPPPSPLRWRSGLGAGILTKLGLSGLVAVEEDELRGKFAALVCNPLLRAAWRERLEGLGDSVATEGVDAPSPHGILSEGDGRAYAAAMLALAKMPRETVVGAVG